MQLCYTCKKCRQINEIKISAIDRPQIRDAYPSGMSLVCETCKHQDAIQPNDVKARESKYNGLITILAEVVTI